MPLRDYILEHLGTPVTPGWPLESTGLLQRGIRRQKSTANYRFNGLDFHAPGYKIIVGLTNNDCDK